MLIIGVCKSKQKQTHYSRMSGERLIYRYPVMKAYFYDEGRFGTKYLHGLVEIATMKAAVHRLKTYLCERCGNKYRSNMKRCPFCV